MQLTKQLPLATTSLRPEGLSLKSLDEAIDLVDPPATKTWIRLPGIRVESKSYPEFVDPNAEIITGSFNVSGRASHLVPNDYFANPCTEIYGGRADDIPCNDINFEMSSGNIWDFMEAMMGPVFLGRVGPSEREGIRIDPDSGNMFLRANGVELQLTTID